MKSIFIKSVFLIGCLALLGLTGCGQHQQPSMGAGAKGPPEVLVRLPVIKEITDFEEFPGRLEAKETILIRARVTGYLLPAPPDQEKEKGTRRYFKEGGLVKKGDLLFKVDPQLYEAQLALSEGSVMEAQGQLDQAKADWERAQKLHIPTEISASDVSKFRGAYIMAEGKLKAAKASLKMAQVNMSYTNVVAPIGGRISRAAIDPGNLVRADDTLLTSIGAADPMKATFDLDERTLARILNLIKQGDLNKEQEDRNDFTGTPVHLWMADEDMESDKPLSGLIDFTDNNVDPSTGTFRVRGVFANPDGLLVPGMFVRVRVPIGKPQKAILVEEKALVTDQGQKYVYVVKNENTEQHEGSVEYRQVKLGRLHEGLRVIKENLAANEKVLVSGLQRVRPDIKVSFKEAPDPTKKNTDDARDPTKPKATSKSGAVSRSPSLKAPPSQLRDGKATTKKGKEH